MQLSEDRDYGFYITQGPHRLGSLYLIIVSLLLGCTTAAPSGDQSSGQNTRRVQEDPNQVLLKSLSTDKDSMTQSIFVALSENAQALDKWEKSEGWIQLYQGQVTKAIEAFVKEQKSDDSEVARSAHVGHIRALLELSVSFEHLVEINQYLLPKWLAYERSRPNSKVHSKWYDLIELLYLSDLDSAENHKERIEKLKEDLASKSLMRDWMKVLLEDSQDMPRSPKIKSTYRRWMTFATAVKKGLLDKASKKLRKLKSNGQILLSEMGEGVPSLEVFDPRVPSILTQYYAQSVVEGCKSIDFGHYYCARAYEILDEKEQAIIEFKKALNQLADLEKKSKSSQIEHVLITAHASVSDFKSEIYSRLISLGVPRKDLAAMDYSVSTMTTAQLVWSCLTLSHQQELPILFPERRRALGILYSSALENAKGASKDYVASLGLHDRWLDELHYQYAKELVERDQRVRALKVLNAAEEAKAGSRLQGRNRLPRLLLSTYNQLKMDRYRVSAKYFQRLKDKLPALSFVLIMTSDILSGKSFENNGSRANAGQ